jgi:hypothetical protein
VRQHPTWAPRRRLLPRFEVEREELARDVLAFLADLAGRGWVVPA